MSTVTLTAPHPVATALSTIHDEVSCIFLERRAVIESAIITILAKHHWYGLGLPGTGKSDLIRELMERIVGATYFEQLLSKQRPDAAVLGPYDLPLLRTNGTFKRKDTGFLTTVNYAFLDEVGKMSPTLGHDLLAALNERVKHEVNGSRSVHPIPLYSVFTASNELIVEESEDAAALWDRLLVRVLIEGIQESGNMAILLQSAVAGNDPRLTAPVRTTVDWADLQDVIDNVVPAIDVPLNVIETLLKLRDEMRAAEIVISDRRWRQCVRLLQASAFYHGRTEVNEDDIHVLRYALWDVPTQISAVERLCLSLSNPVAEKCLSIMDGAEDVSRGIRDRKGQSLESRAAFGTEANGKLKLLISELAQLRQECVAAGRSTTKLDEVADRLAAVRRSVYVDCLDMDPASIR